MFSLLYSCSDASPKQDKDKPEKYTRQPNPHWEECKYKDVVKQMLKLKLEYNLGVKQMKKSYMSQEFLDLYDPKYTDQSVTKLLESEIEAFMSASSRIDVSVSGTTDTVKIEPVVIQAQDSTRDTTVKLRPVVIDINY